MSDVTPPVTSPAAFLGWAVAGLLLVAGALFRSLEKAREGALADLKAAHAGELAALRAQLDEARRREGERREERDRLGRLLDEEKFARAQDAQRMALAVARRAPPEQAFLAEGWEELPTAVRSRLDLVAQALAPVPLSAAEERRLGRYVSGGALTTPPEAPRPRLPSRPR